jgi:prepilin-type processing-associated H-X9-DG protein
VVPFNNGSLYPTHHGGRMDAMFYDGNVELLKPTELRASNFREPA